MLSKPGEARKSSTSQRRTRKVVEEKLDDVVRRLQRLPPNKACADCPVKITQCVNLTHGTFICNACSGIHREFNHKIKGIGHSSFSADEVAMLRHPSSGNEAVNSHHLATYSLGDRMKRPHDNSDLQHLRTWIQMKYIDKKWCEDKGEGGGGGKEGGRKGSASSSSKLKSKSSSTDRPSSKSKGEAHRRKIMPKAANKSKPPPKTVPTPLSSTASDLFDGFDAIAPSPAPSNDSSWDAFGGPARNGGPPAAPPPPAAAPAAAFQAGFGSFPQQPTMASLPPQQQQPAFQASFDQAPVVQAVQQQPDQAMQQQTNRVQAAGFANFSAQQNQFPQQPAQQNQFPQQPAQQQGVPNNQQGGFANFASVAPPQQQQQQQQNQFPQQLQHNQYSQQQQPHMVQARNVQMQGAATMNQQQGQPQQQPRTNVQPLQNSAQMPGAGTANQQQQGGFGQFPQQQPPAPQMQMQQQPPAPQMQQQPPAPQVQHQHPAQQMQQHPGGGVPNGQQGGFADFSSAPAPQQTNQFPQAQHQPTQAPGQAPNAHAPGAGGVTNQQLGGAPLQRSTSAQGASIGGPADQPPGGGMAAQPPQQGLSATQPPPPAQPPQNAPMPPQGAAGMVGQQGNFVSNGERSAGAAGVPAQPPVPAPLSQQPQNEAPNPNAFGSAENDRKSAFDAFDGLSFEPTPSIFNTTVTAARRAAATLAAPSPAPSKDLNFAPYHEGQEVLYRNGEGSYAAAVTKVHFDDQLNPYYTISLNGREKQTDGAHLSLPVESSMQNSVNGGTSTLLQETASMLEGLDSQQLLQIKQLVSSMVSGNGDRATASYGHAIAANQEQKLTSFGSSQGNGLPGVPMGGAPAPPPPAQGAPAPAQFSVQQHSNQAPPVAQASAMPAPAQYSMQQQPNQGMPHQQMGMGTTVPAATTTPPSAMPPPPPAQMPAPAQFSMQQQQPIQQAMGMGMPVVPSPAMPSPSPGQAPAQFPMQQQPNQGFPQQPMGMGAPSSAMPPPPPGQALTQAQFTLQQQQQNPNHGIPQQIRVPVAPSSAMPPPSPGQALAPAQFSMQQQQPNQNHGIPQQPMGMGMNSSAAALSAMTAPTALPPVEKEGNPFDFY